MNDVVVLCYHAVSDEWSAPLAVTPSGLERQVGSLLRRGYRGVVFSQAATAASASRTFSVTFDDGFRSVATLGLPVLAALGIPATVFVPTAWVGSQQPMAWPGIGHWLSTDHEPELAPLSWDELGELQSAGWEVGSHSVSHPLLTQLDDQRLRAELHDSREEIQDRLSILCRSLAYPYGDVDERVVRATDSAGYQFAAALPRKWHANTALEWPRVGVYRRDGILRFLVKSSRGYRRLRSR